MIFDTIYNFYFSLFSSGDDVSAFWADWVSSMYDGTIGDYVNYYGVDVICAIATFVTIVCGIFALFRILGGILRLFKV